jgi:predicted RNase H-like nuclease (RuvC/YqgF family)
MEGRAVSSSATASQMSDKHNCRRWNDDPCSNITYTKSWYREEIKKLKGEISKLEENLKEDKETFSTVNLNASLGKLMNKLSKDKQAPLEGLDIKGKLNEDGEIDIKRLERFTGFCIHDVSLTVEQGKGDLCVRKHHIQGSCRNIQFETTFLVEENTNEDEDVLPGIKTYRRLLM